MKEKYFYKPIKKNKDAIPVWMSFPYTYMYGMSTLGYLSLFKELDTNPDAEVERIFSNSKTTGIKPRLVELFGFSYIFETDFLSIFKILESYKIPLMADKRDKHPLIFAGGPVLTTNPEPFADFFDFIIIGDGENVLNEIIKVYKQVRNSSRREKLEELAKIEGVYVPSLYQPIYGENNNLTDFLPVKKNLPATIKKRTADVEDCIYSPIVSSDAFYPDTLFIELGRGCPFKCKFCPASYLNNPVRYPSIDSIKSIIDKGIKAVKKIVFIGAMISEHPDFDKICDYITNLRKKRTFSLEFSSLKAQEYNQKAVDALVMCNQEEVSIAIETGSQRLRDSVLKELSETQLFDTVKLLNKSGLKKLSIYTMIGLPGETEGDINEFINLAAGLKEDNNKLQISYLISSFIPKPNTPYEKMARESNIILENRINIIKEEFSKLQIEAKYPNLVFDYINTFISRADRRAGAFLEQIYKKSIKPKDWKDYYRKTFQTNTNKVPDIDYWVEKEIPGNHLVPWNHINIDFLPSDTSNVSHEFLNI